MQKDITIIIRETVEVPIQESVMIISAVLDYKREEKFSKKKSSPPFYFFFNIFFIRTLLHDI